MEAALTGAALDWIWSESETCFFILKYYQKINTVAAAMQIPAVSHREEGWMFQHRELSAMWSQLFLQEKHPMGTCCPCLSQCCHPNCFGNSYLLFNAGSWVSSTELQARHPPRLSLRPGDLAGSCQCSTAIKLIMNEFLND